MARRQGSGAVSVLCDSSISVDHIIKKAPEVEKRTVPLQKFTLPRYVASYAKLLMGTQFH